jgi:mono/diheme cytochrome c family protein
MRTIFRILAVVVLVIVLVAAGAYTWASIASSRKLSRTMTAHSVDFPIPFPLAPDEPGADAPDEAERQQLALTRAVERGKYLVGARYACLECHGANGGGGVMVDAFPLGTLLGPNLTSGAGSRTVGFTPADWDRIVRHGIRRDGRPAVMPSIDFQLMSDQELSDIVAYLQSLAPVDSAVPEPSLGPLGKFLVATGELPLSADEIASHDTPHVSHPPPAVASAQFGRHVAGVCTGCHGQDLSGGPIHGGDPSWVPARNLTPHPDALGGWTYDQFVQAMREGRRPDGAELRVPMTFITPYAQRMADVELQALWAYLRSVPPVAGPQPSR